MTSTSMQHIGLKPALCLCLFLSLTAVTAPAAFRTVAVNGNEAPDTGGLLFSHFKSPTINQSGQVMVHGYIPQNAQITWQNDNGYWIYSPDGTTTKIMRWGDPADSFSTNILYANAQPDPLLCDNGYVLFRAQLKGTGIATSNDYVYLQRETNSTWNLLAREGDGHSSLGTTIGGNQAGNIGFIANLTGPGVNSVNDDGLWLDTGSGPVLIAREFSQVPGQPAGVLYNDPFTAPFLNTNGQAVFRCYLQGGGFGTGSTMAIASHGNATTEILFHIGQQVPGEPAGITFEFFAGAILNDSGQIALHARLTGTGINSTNQESLWLTDATGTPERILQAGTTEIPNTGGARFLAQDAADFLVCPLNDTGDLAGRMILQGGGVNSSSDRCIILRENNGTIHLAAREGDQAAGTPAGVRWGNYFGTPGLNNRGRIVFDCNLTGTGVTENNDGGLWMWDAAHGAQLIVREGDLFEAAPGSWRTIRYISLRVTEQDSIRYRSINDRNEIAFALRFTDDTGGTYVYYEPEIKTFSNSGSNQWILSGGPTIPGHLYDVEWIETLASTNWTASGFDYPGTGGYLDFPLSASSPVRFFRLLEKQ